MTLEQFHKNLTPPKGKVDVILDTDAYNEIDDQYAISYMLANPEKLNVLGITAAPFYNENSKSPEDGMEKSYYEIMKILSLFRREDLASKVFMGSRRYLPSESIADESPAAEFIVSEAKNTAPKTLSI